ncbi:anoctamin-4-like isoform X2 [Liolophura sinensis]|uniref:anoctamin-4-like isoform X2 n=1 Tax=Liolophura sinensis TaxID=3198878 RepID=UPI003158FEB2
MSSETNLNSSLKLATSTTQAHVRFQRFGAQQNKKRRAHIAGGLKRKMTPFERRYSELGHDLIPEKKRIDYVLVHPHRRLEEHDSKNKKLDYERHESNRSQFEVACKAEGLRIQKDIVGNMVYTKLHTPFKRMCLEAERINMEMPLRGCEIYDDGPSSSCSLWVEKHFETDDEVDFVSAPFLMDRIHLYQGYEDPSNFFRPAQRSWLTHTILINMDMRKCATQREMSSVKESTRKASEERVKYSKHMGLPYLLMKGSYTDAYILHDESETDPIDLEKRKAEKMKSKVDKVPLGGGAARNEDGDISLGKLPDLDFDPRKDLNNSWTKFFKFQPLWKVRNYFGEKIALYFAWCGQLITSLWIPTIFGVCVFFFGISESVFKHNALIESKTNRNVTSDDFFEGAKETITFLLTVIKEAFDNEITPYFALVVCLWGTIFLEFWKRKNATLSYEWDVDQYENNEPDRPQFYGTKKKPDPVTRELNWFYPLKRKFLKYCASFSTLLFMVLLVFVSVVGVIVYRLVMTVDFCPNISSVQCLILTSILSSVLNAISILLLGKIYDKLAVLLTDWENHRTQTSYDDALIMKLFGFQFANSYTSCFYIAFFRGRDFDSNGVFGMGGNYVDGCTDDNCMSQLSFQILVLMIMKPFPKFFKDIILPFLRKLWRMRPSWCCWCCGQNKNKVDEESGASPAGSRRLAFQQYLEREREKPVLGDFTLAEYTEKVILYGYLMLFAASFPLAPLLALVTLLIDIRVDARRILWWYRRPVAFIAQDLGMWYSILNFLNIFGVVSNSFLIAFTSSWGSQFSSYHKLWVVILFEHIVFVVKFLLAYIIPDIPSDVKLAIRREKYQVNRILESAKKNIPTDFHNLVPEPVKPSETSSLTTNAFSSLPPLHPVNENLRQEALNHSYGTVSSSGVVPLDTTTEPDDHDTKEKSMITCTT